MHIFVIVPVCSDFRFLILEHSGENVVFCCEMLRFYECEPWKKLLCFVVLFYSYSFSFSHEEPNILKELTLQIYYILHIY